MQLLHLTWRAFSQGLRKIDTFHTAATILYVSYIYTTENLKKRTLLVHKMLSKFELHHGKGEPNLRQSSTKAAIKERNKTTSGMIAITLCHHKAGSENVVMLKHPEWMNAKSKQYYMSTGRAHSKIHTMFAPPVFAFSWVNVHWCWSLFT